MDGAVGTPLASECPLDSQWLETPAVITFTREQRKMQDLFGALAFALRSFKNLNQVLELVAFVASHLTDADGGALVLFQPDGTIALEQLHCASLPQREGIRAALERITRALSREASQRVARPRAVDALQETAALPLHNSPFDSSEYSTCIERHLDEQLQQEAENTIFYGTPLLVRNTVRGRLYIFSQEPSFVWTEGRQQLLRVIADQAAVAIENDELTVALQKRIAVDKELEIGSEIQAQLLPKHYPQVAGVKLAARCQTASKVGGDYYDFIAIPSRSQDPSPQASTAQDPNSREPHRLGIVIGDVMGKGVPAGLLMTMTRGMLRAEVLNHHSPARILEHLNQVMFEDLERSNRFISLFYSDYDPVTRQLRFSNAAHNPTLLWRAATHQIESLDTAGPLVGLTPNSTYGENSVCLHPGDVVIYYTDGFTEAANSQGERLETSGLEEAIRYASEHFQDPQDILNCLFDRVDIFRGRSDWRPVSSPPYMEVLLQDLDPEDLAPINAQVLQSRMMSPDDMTLVVLKILPESPNQ